MATAPPAGGDGAILPVWRAPPKRSAPATLDSAPLRRPLWPSGVFTPVRDPSRLGGTAVLASRRWQPAKLLDPLLLWVIGSGDITACSMIKSRTSGRRVFSQKIAAATDWCPIADRLAVEALRDLNGDLDRPDVELVAMVLSRRLGIGCFRHQHVRV